MASGVVANLHGWFEWLRLSLDDGQTDQFSNLLGNGLDFTLAYG